MHAQFFSVEPRAGQAAQEHHRTDAGARMRQVHRWVSMTFSLTVAANFLVMIWRQPPGWITYAPLPPLPMARRVTRSSR